jgi:aspartyl-tRNA(Asn)/glutamyl-tRNA(Gln) amidotransferase subunit A
LTLNQLTAHEAINLIRKKKITAYEVIQDIFNQIDKVDNFIKAFLILNKKEALKQAKKIDIKVKNGDKIPSFLFHHIMLL